MLALGFSFPFLSLPLRARFWLGNLVFSRLLLEPFALVLASEAVAVDVRHESRAVEFEKFFKFGFGLLVDVVEQNLSHLRCAHCVLVCVVHVTLCAFVCRYRNSNARVKTSVSNRAHGKQRKLTRKIWL